jgi:hypothetical protein
MKRENELSAAEAEHIVFLAIWAGIPQMVLKRVIPQPPTGFFDKIRWVLDHTTPHERRVLGAKDFSDASFRRAILNATRKVTQGQERRGKGRKKRRRAESED